MTTNRSYRRGMNHERAIAELQQYAGIQFDPEIVEVFARLPEHLLTPGKDSALELPVGTVEEVAIG